MKTRFILCSLFVFFLMSCGENTSEVSEEEIEEATKKEVAFNEKYLADLKEIRETKKDSEENIKTIGENLTLAFPSSYKIEKRRASGVYIFALSDSLVFDNSDENLIQYQINDTTGVKADGHLNILKKESVEHDFQETIDNIKSTNYFELVDHDETGYIYLQIKTYTFVRYFKKEGTHYHYTMEFDNLEDCVREFDRSKRIIK